MSVDYRVEALGLRVGKWFKVSEEVHEKTNMLKSRKACTIQNLPKTPGFRASLLHNGRCIRNCHTTEGLAPNSYTFMGYAY